MEGSRVRTRFQLLPNAVLTLLVGSPQSGTEVPNYMERYPHLHLSIADRPITRACSGQTASFSGKRPASSRRPSPIRLETSKSTTSPSSA